MALERSDLRRRETKRQTGQNRSFLRRRQDSPAAPPRRALTASAREIDLRDKTEARKLRVLRQGWQGDAANYVSAIPELSFAYRFMAHASARMRYFPAFVNPEEPDGPPVHVTEVSNLDSGFRDSMSQAMADLGVGRLALSPLQESMSTNLGAVGECFLLGQQEPSGNKWTIRSIEEFMVFDDQYKLREIPMDPQGILGWVDLDPQTTYAARMWTPHWRYQLMADSPMRALLDVAEELLLLSRDVRAVARSRLAGAGILKIPEGLRMESMLEDNEDPESENWFGRLAAAMMTPISDEGVASAVVPIGLTGEPDSLAQLDHLLLDRPYSALAIELRAEAIGRIATGLDVPREVLEGMSDPNHWGAWLVSDDTFRHHIEPQVIAQVDALTVAYLRPWLTAAGFAPKLVNRACIWYDAVDLISKPDPFPNALQAHDRLIISNKALRTAGGFTDSDAPSELEIEFRMLQKTRTFPPNMVEAIFHAWDPELKFPPITVAGTIPGIGASGEVTGNEIETVTETPNGTPVLPPPGPPDAAALPAPQPSMLPPASSPTAVSPTQRAAITEAFAAAQAKTDTYRRLSRRLSEVDATLRARVQTAAAGAMMRLLDRAGAKLRTRVQSRQYRSDDTLSMIHGVPNRSVANQLGRPLVASLGYPDPQALLSPDWSELHEQFLGWTAAAQRQALRVAAQLAQVPDTDRRVRRAADRLSAQLEPAWQHLESQLNALAERLLYNPDPNASDTITVDPNTVVPTGVVRSALTIAGGGVPKALRAASPPVVDVSEDTGPPGDSPHAGEDGEPTVGAQVSVDIPDGQIGSGDAIGDMLDAADLQAVSYEWVHGPTLRPFDPHEQLDGVAFSSFDDDVLTNDTGFPENDFYFPGDHDGCSCDFSTTWGPADSADTPTDDTGDAAGDAVASADDAGTGAADVLDQVAAGVASPGDFASAMGYTRAAPTVTDSDVSAALKSLAGLRNDIRGQADQISRDYAATLDNAEVGRGMVQSPIGRGQSWYEGLTTDEKTRLRIGNWFAPKGDTTAMGEDEVGEALARAGLAPAQGTDPMISWVQQTRIVDASRALSNGRAINPDLYGGLNINHLVDTPYDLNKLMPGPVTSANKLSAAEKAAQAPASAADEAAKKAAAKDLYLANRTEAARYVAQVQAESRGDEAWQTLKTPVGGPDPREMTQNEYVAEVTSLEAQAQGIVPLSEDDVFGPTYSTADRDVLARLQTLIPPGMDPEGTLPLDVLYDSIIKLARETGRI